MPQMSNIVLTGDVDHTYAPRGRDENNVALFVETTGVPLADRRLTVQRSRTSQGREKVSMKLTIPVMQNAVVDGISRPSIVRTAYADVVLTFDGTSTTAERNNVRLQLADLLGAGQSVSADLIDNLDVLY